MQVPFFSSLYCWIISVCCILAIAGIYHTTSSGIPACAWSLSYYFSVHYFFPSQHDECLVCDSINTQVVQRMFFRGEVPFVSRQTQNILGYSCTRVLCEPMTPSVREPSVYSHTTQKEKSLMGASLALSTLNMTIITAVNDINIMNNNLALFRGDVFRVLSKRRVYIGSYTHTHSSIHYYEPQTDDTRAQGTEHS